MTAPEARQDVLDRLRECLQCHYDPVESASVKRAGTADEKPGEWRYHVVLSSGLTGDELSAIAGRTFEIIEVTPLADVLTGHKHGPEAETSLELILRIKPPLAPEAEARGEAE